MTITTTCRFNGKFDKGLDSLRVEFAPPTMERYSYGPLGVTASIIVWPDTGDNVMGMSKHDNEKEEQNWQRGNRNGSMCRLKRIPIHLTPGFVKYREAKGIAHDNQRFTRMSFMYT